MSIYTEGPDTLKEPNATVPETRMKSASDAQSIFQSLYQSDNNYRARKRAMVKGLVDGNPPYRAIDLRNAGRSNDCNVNWRIAEAYLNSAKDAFYDIFSESPTYATVVLDMNGKSDRENKSAIVTEEFDRLQKREKGFDYWTQLSQEEMVLYGFGPFIFEDSVDWRPRSGKCGDFYVPDNARSETGEWEYCMMRVEYLPHQLYEFIRNEKAADDIGWDVPYTKNAIMDAHPRTGNTQLNWEWYQQQLKNGSFSYSSQSKKIFTVHVWCREFPKDGEVEGRISHKIFLEDVNDGKEFKFLFEKIGRYKSWDECVHAMYYDHGGGGEHHSVTGMGVKMYSAMEYQNRLLCKLADDAFAPKLMFKPLSAGQGQKMSLAVFGNYAVHPAGFDMIQTPTNPLMADTLMVNREITQMVSSNLSQYRQNLQKEKGNPVTAREIDQRASEQARLGKTQLNRYYDQLDRLYAEKYRRATNLNLSDSAPGGKEALEFQKRCEKRGVSKQELVKIDSVRATRVVGQGSPFMRLQSLEFLLGLIGMFPEGGRENLTRDIIAARAGQSSVSRYYPVAPQNQRPTDQHSEAQDKVAGMKVGLMPIVTDTQNPVIYAQTYLQAASAATASLEQTNGSNIMEVFSFLELAGPAIAAQLERIKIDPTRKQVYDLLREQWEALAKIHDQLGQQIQQQQQRQGEVAQEIDADTQKAQNDMAIKSAKAQQMLQQKRDKHIQSMAINDVKTAQSVASE